MDWRDVERGWSGCSIARRPASSSSPAILPAVRTFISLPAGFVAHAGLAHILLWSTVGTAIWSAPARRRRLRLGTAFGRSTDIVGPVSPAIVVG